MGTVGQVYLFEHIQHVYLLNVSLVSYFIASFILIRSFLSPCPRYFYFFFFSSVFKLFWKRMLEIGLTGKKVIYDKGKVLTVFPVLFYLKVIGEKKNKLG